MSTEYIAPHTTAGFCRAAGNIVRRFYGPEKLRLFFLLRYDRMAQRHPHGVFSVEQASPDFFDTALAHIMGTRPLPAPTSEYVRNYIAWIRQAQQEK